MMTLNVLLPFGVFKQEQQVQRIVAETDQGSFGLLPQRLDCVAALVPGILVYQIGLKPESYIAIDAGVLIKTGFEVCVSVRHAVAGADLNVLQETVEEDFKRQNQQEKALHSVFQKLESDFMSRLIAFRHEKSE